MSNVVFFIFLNKLINFNIGNMKKLFFLMIMSLSLLSCSEDIQEKDQADLQLAEEFSGKDFIGSTVATLEKDKIKFRLNEVELLNSFNKYAKERNLNLNAISYGIIEADNNFYLRFYNDDNSVSTVALKRSGQFSKSHNGNELIETGNTVCTSKACATCCGCLPDGDYCTRCEMGEDCTRSTSGN